MTITNAYVYLNTDCLDSLKNSSWNMPIMCTLSVKQGELKWWTLASHRKAQFYT